jgi:hypothetical protein
MQCSFHGSLSESTAAFTVNPEDVKHHNDFLRIAEDGSIESILPLLNPTNQW